MLPLGFFGSSSTKTTLASDDGDYDVPALKGRSTGGGLYLCLDEVDAVFDRAVAAGRRTVFPLGDDRPQVPIADPAAWRSWLESNAATSSGIWLVYEKGLGRRLSYDDIVEEALRFGWVDSRPRTLDDHRAMLLLAPRTPTSAWSRVNMQRVERLMAAGAMTPAGLAAVGAAQANGRWSALDAVEDLVEPDDLRAPRVDLRGEAACEPVRPRGRDVDEAAVGRRANQWRQPGEQR